MDNRILDIKFVVAGFVVCSLIFAAFPEIDLYIAGRFWSQTSGFFLSDKLVFVVLYDVFAIIAAPFALLLIMLILGSYLLQYLKSGLVTNYLIVYRRQIVFLLLLLIIGSVVVEIFFKLVWGRARPRDILEFGGELIFTPAWIISGQCNSNCSFMSGHSSIGFYFMAAAWLAKRAVWLLPGLFLGLALSLTRIVQGGHFLSDVILPGFVVYILAHYLALLLLNKTE